MKVIRTIAPAVFAGLLFIALAQANAASPANDVAAIPEGAREPPLCTDKRWLKNVKTQYDALEAQGDHLTVKEIGDVKQLHFGPSPASVNQYATKTTYGVTSRYCQGTALLGGGKTDPVFWRMDYIVEARGHSINFDHCSLKHDLIDPKCQKHRDGK